MQALITSFFCWTSPDLPINSALVGDFGQLDYITPTVGCKGYRNPGLSPLEYPSSLTVPCSALAHSAEHTAVRCANGVAV